MPETIDTRFIQYLENACGASVSEPQIIQHLWSGYGVCFRTILSSVNTPNSCFSKPTPVVVKCVTPPDVLSHPKGWNGETGHNRKLASFKIENSFYQHLQPLTSQDCYVPSCFAVKQWQQGSLLVMEDLASAGFSKTTHTLTMKQTKTVLAWLANFHARFLSLDTSTVLKDIDVWSEGSYWHLGTRQDEYQRMPEGALKTHAAAIAQRLSNAKYKTLIHGDAKVANFCFSSDFSACAAVDFQYVGFGIGVKDVAYFLGSALSDEDQQAHGESCLSDYFTLLKQALTQRNIKSINEKTSLDAQQIDELIEEWKYLYSFACADFHRFLAGWSPEHWKINSELQRQTDIALSQL